MSYDGYTVGVPVGGNEWARVDGVPLCRQPISYIKGGKDVGAKYSPPIKTR